MSPSIHRLSDACKHLVVPSGIVSTAWPGVADKLDDLGIRFHWWQEQAARLILGKRADGLYATAESASYVSVARQTGKTTLVGGISLGLQMQDPMRVLWTSHMLRTTNDTFEKMRALCSREAVRPFVRSMRTVNGEGAIIFTNGSDILFGARERGFGVGIPNVSVVVIDEAQRASQQAVDDMVPATNVVENALVMLLMTPPRPTDKGTIVRDRREEVLSGGDPDSLWLELGADDDCDPYSWKGGYIDWAQVGKACPLYPDLVSKTAVRRLKRLLGIDSFCREGLGKWDQVKADRLIPSDEWVRQVIEAEGERLPKSERIVSDVVACVHASRDRQWVWIALCGERADGLAQVEIPVCLAPIEVAGWLEERRDRIRAVTGQTRGADRTSELIEELKADRTFRIPVEDWVGPELPAAHGRGLDALRDGRIRTAYHEDLEVAVGGAVGKPLLGGVVVDRNVSETEPGPLSAWFGAYGLWSRPKAEKVVVAPPTPRHVPSPVDWVDVNAIRF